MLRGIVNRLCGGIDRRQAELERLLVTLAAIGNALTQTEKRLDAIERKLEHMANTVQDLVNAVQAEDTQIDSIVALVNQLGDIIKNTVPGLTPEQQAAIDNTVNDIVSRTAQIQQAVATNSQGQPAPAANAGTAASTTVGPAA